MSTFGAKKLLQQSCRGGGSFSRHNIHNRVMMTGRLLEEPGTMCDGASFWIERCKHEPWYPSHRDRAGAHCTRLQRYKERACDQTLVAHLLRRTSDRKDFCVRSWIAQSDNFISGACQKFAGVLADYNCANGNFTARCSISRLC